LPLITVIIPTLGGGQPLARCLACLEAQTFRDFDVLILDNSACGAAAALAETPGVCVIQAGGNLGFGAAVNRGIDASTSPWICALNDDAYPKPEFLRELAGAASRFPEAGMFASQIRLSVEPGLLDSAGLSIYGDGTTKQRGHREPAEMYSEEEEVLLPSACAALYRRSMLDQIGAFDPDYFLYCEDTDLGLRARRAGWPCFYVPAAIVEHDYSLSAGRASRLKALYVERNRLYTVVKNFPSWLWPAVPCYSLWRYLLYFGALLSGRGLAADFRRSGEKWWRLVLIVVSAHGHALLHLPRLLAKRRQTDRIAKLSSWAFWKLMRRHYVRASRIVVQ
jgi:GT2 family glycosyltransferase